MHKRPFFIGRLVVSAAILCLLISYPARTQTSTGQLSVTVTDPSGAVVPNATVRITGSQTGNVLRTLQTNETGVAPIPLVPPGDYDLSVSAAGFKNVLRRAITISAGSVVEIPVLLEPGSASESITITAEAPLVEEKSATLAQVVSEKQILDMPLNGRNYLALANLTAGAIPSSNSRDQTFSAYGNTGLQNAFLLDGGRNENYLRGLDNRTRDMVRPPLDALAEFTVQTSNFSAEFGAAAGGVVNAITKSGTNSIHGSAYDFLRNDNLDARNFFAQTKPLLVRNQYGGSLGGPVKKDKIWAFGAYEGIHNRAETSSYSTVPTVAQRNANFGSNAIFDPDTTRANPNGSGYIRDQFPSNIIPASRLNSIGVNMLSRYPLPNAPGSATQFAWNVPQFQDNKNGVARGDAQVTSKDSMFGRYAKAQSGLLAYAGLPAPAGMPVDRSVDSASAGYGYTRTLSPTLINEFRFTWTTINMHQDGTLPREEIIPGSLDSRITSGPPGFNVSNIPTIGAQPGCCGNSPLTKTSGVWDWSDNVSKTFGSHVMKFGGEFMSIRPGTFAASNGRGSFGFTGVFTQNPQGRSGTGNSIADLLLGDANSLTTGTPAEAVERGWFGAGYLQDQWTIVPRLTLSLGIRYEYASPYIETQNRMADFILDGGDPLFGQFIVSGDSRRPRPLIYGDKKNWAPRVGFAYRVPKVKDLIVRSSFGIFYAQDQGTGVTNRMTSNPPFWGYGAQTISSDQLFPSSGFVLTSGASINRPSPIDPSKFKLIPTATTQLVSWPTYPKTPYVEEWSFSIAKSLPWNMMAEVNYVGNHGVQIFGIGEGNQPMVLSATTVISRRPLSQYTVASIKTAQNWNMSKYQGLSSKLEKRFSAGVSFLTTFTYGHALDLQNPALDLCDGCGSGDTIQNNYDRAANYSSSDNDVRFRYVLAGSFELPFGKGKPWLAQSGPGSAIFGGWRLTTIYQTQTGLPFTPGMSFDSANAGTTSRPNRVCDGNLSGGGTLQKYFDTSCFAAAPSYTFGNAGRNILRAPLMNNLDASIQRDFRMPIEHETILQFRAEGFNALNHPQFGMPGATVGSPTYGMIQSTSVDNRQFQLGLRVSF
jgi:hypothetical protein